MRRRSAWKHELRSDDSLSPKFTPPVLPQETPLCPEEGSLDTRVLNAWACENCTKPEIRIALSVPDFVDQLLWVYGKKTVEEAVSVTNKMTLKGVADKITCPLLILHGENDRLVPLSEAQKLFAEAVNSPGKKLKVFTLAEGGSEHCQVDNNAMALDDMADWVAEVLGGDPKGV